MIESVNNLQGETTYPLIFLGAAIWLGMLARALYSVADWILYWVSVRDLRAYSDQRLDEMERNLAERAALKNRRLTNADR